MKRRWVRTANAESGSFRALALLEEVAVVNSCCGKVKVTRSYTENIIEYQHNTKVINLYRFYIPSFPLFLNLPIDFMSAPRHA